MIGLCTPVFRGNLKGLLQGNARRLRGYHELVRAHRLGRHRRVDRRLEQFLDTGFTDRAPKASDSRVASQGGRGS